MAGLVVVAALYGPLVIGGGWWLVSASELRTAL
jgi:hypothetical protein